jgi:hypothetical protein
MLLTPFVMRENRAERLTRVVSPPEHTAGAGATGPALASARSGVQPIAAKLELTRGVLTDLRGIPSQRRGLREPFPWERRSAVSSGGIPEPARAYRSPDAEIVIIQTSPSLCDWR